MVSGNTRVIQVTNIAPQATKDQMQTLFGYLGKIDDIRLYPTIRDVSCPVQSRICYVKYYDSATVNVAQHMTNTVFIDRALIVIPMQSGEIPDEHKALEMSSNGTLVPGLSSVEPRLPPHVINTLEGVPPNQVIQSHDPKIVAAGLPPYPPLPAAYDSRKIEEIRRTLLVIDVGELTHQHLIDIFCAAGEVKYVRFCERDIGDKLKYALVELSEQESVLKALQLSGSIVEGQLIRVHHATQAISKPQTKSNEAAQREIEEAMCRVKEAQNLISAAIDPVIGMLSKEKRRTRSRSRSRSRRSRSRRSRSRHRARRSRSRSRHRSRRSRSRGRHRSRSRSHHRSRRSRSRSRHRTSRSRKDRSRDRDKDKDKDKDRRDKKEKEKDSEDKKDKSVSPPKPVNKEEKVEKKEAETNGNGETKSSTPPDDKEKEVVEKERSPSKKRDRSRSREKKRSRSRRRSRSRSRRKRSRSRERRRSRSRKRSRSRDRRRSRSRDRKRSRSRDRKKTRSRDRKRTRSRDKSDRKRSRSGDRKRSRSRSRRSSKTPRDRTPNLSTVVEVPDTSTETRPIDEEKNSPDNMDISNSP